MSIQQLIQVHKQRYSKLEQQDILKLLFQHSFGCEHLIDNPCKTLERIQEECLQTTRTTCEIEPIGNGFVRFHLFRASKLECKTINQLFVASSKIKRGQQTVFIQCLQELDIIIDENQPLQPYRHSKSFRECYQPHYRVLDQRLATYYPLFLEINKLLETKQSIIVAIDGKAGSGKSTLAKLLASMYDTNLFHLDDFFLQKHQRTPERFLVPGGNVDHERFLQEVLLPVKHGHVVQYRKFLCSKMELDTQVTSYPLKQLTVIEGSYSMLPSLQVHYDCKVLLDVDNKEQLRRIRKRNDEVHVQQFIDKWIPLENKYFEYYHLYNTIPFIFNTTSFYLP